MSQKILVIGKGFLGTKLLSYLHSKKFDAIGASINDKYFPVDITIKKQVKSLIGRIKPKTVLLAAGKTGIQFCEENKKIAEKTNVLGVKNVAEECKNHDSKLVFFSSDAVFSGDKKNYSEKDTPGPKTFYGKNKVKAEKIVLRHMNNLVIRTSAVYGFSGFSGRQSFFLTAVNSLESNKKISAAIDCIFSPTLAEDVCAATLELIKKKETGIFHCSGAEPISRYGFTKKIAKVFGFNQELVKKVTAFELNNQYLQTSDYSMDISKLNSLGVKMHDCESGLRIAKKQYRRKITGNK